MHCVTPIVESVACRRLLSYNPTIKFDGCENDKLYDSSRAVMGLFLLCLQYKMVGAMKVNELL